MKLKSKSSVVLAGALFLAACGGSAVTVAGIDSFGSAFRAMFDADRNAEPVDAQSVDIAVSLTDDPFNP
ncbi:hypothetical protein OS190_13160 [Sulfitobacter sp. F26204]|uniref:hypothetical protein n=1 Tax=Sulfitobacter sp. F26204 TaxID=2996014 RepID=UPI00225E6029|nr:hypothetical protein [Sulfitobacter sp. F26204]MCX7560519.1 hypothetical protein [Sulfitobacter sp. F26204]